MSLTAGARLGPYEVLDLIGQGGMGEVYKAKDTRLDRTVAIKILPPQFSDPEHRARFEREARAIATLSHPHICTLHDVGDHAGSMFLVMEHLAGETLAERLRKGALPIDQALTIAGEIGEALAAAHRAGIVHRDLKPANVMLTKSGVKLLDFGVAKLRREARQPVVVTAMTDMQGLTGEGTIVGTLNYMAPEQIEGKDADPRTDIWALGLVLYEMVTGKSAFEGNSAASTIASILTKQPEPIVAVRPLSPPALDRLVRACLAKDPDERIQTAHDARLQLQWIADAPASSDVAVRRRRPSRLTWVLAVVLVLVVAAAGFDRWFRGQQLAPAMYFNAPVPFAANDVALSPEGLTVALVGYSEQTNNYVIWRYEVGGRNPVIVPGTDGASHPFWSPDSRSLGFFSGGKLKTIEVQTGNSAQVLADAPNGRGGTWNRDGVILFTPDVYGGVYRISSSGGMPVAVTEPDRARSETSNRWPVFLPDGRHFLYLGANFSGDFDKNAIGVGALDSKERHVIIRSNANAVYTDGYLLYMRDKALMAQPFDLRTYSLGGAPQVIGDGVQYFPQIDLALFGAATNGILVMQPGRGPNRSQLVWFDRAGKNIGAVGAPGLFANPALSPDGGRVAVDQTDTDGRHVDIWVYQLSNNAAARLTFGPVLNDLAVWSPDGKRIIFGSNRDLGWNLLERKADGSGTEVQYKLSSDTTQHPRDWSQDGKYILVWRNGELWYLSVADQQARPLFQAKWSVRNGRFSPDGKWVAYSSNESGNWEVYVATFPSASSKWQVSQGGGQEPRWRRDGKELFYVSPDGKIVAVPVKPGEEFEAGAPVILFQTHLAQPIQGPDVVSYDVTADGQRFLVNTKIDDPGAAPVAVLLNWRSRLEK